MKKVLLLISILIYGCSDEVNYKERWLFNGKIVTRNAGGDESSCAATVTIYNKNRTFWGIISGCRNDSLLITGYGETLTDLNEIIGGRDGFGIGWRSDITQKQAHKDSIAYFLNYGSIGQDNVLMFYVNPFRYYPKPVYMPYTYFTGVLQ